MLDRAFASLQVYRVVTGTAAANPASCRLLERLGFKKTGESTGSFRNTPDGKPVEFLGYTFAIAKDEWNAAREHP
jgi:RimJ/RimL family protein N-acetyltransferase